MALAPASRRAARNLGRTSTSCPAQSAASQRLRPPRPLHCCRRGTSLPPLRPYTGHCRPRTGMADCLRPGDPRAGRNIPDLGSVLVRRPGPRYPEGATFLRTEALSGNILTKKSLAAPDRRSWVSLNVGSRPMSVAPVACCATQNPTFIYLERSRLCACDSRSPIYKRIPKPDVPPIEPLTRRANCKSIGLSVD